MKVPEHGRGFGWTKSDRVRASVETLATSLSPDVEVDLHWAGSEEKTIAAAVHKAVEKGVDVEDIFNVRLERVHTINRRVEVRPSPPYSIKLRESL